MARYRKIDTRIWNDQKFNALSEDGKLLFFLVLTHPHSTSIGAFRASKQGLAGELHWPLERLGQALTEGIENQMIKHDEHASLIWLPNFLKYNKPESPNVIRSWGTALDCLPECSLKESIITGCNRFVDNLSTKFRKALPEVFRKSMPNQEQEQEQEQDKKKKDLMSGKPDVSPKHFLKHEKKSAFKKQAIEILEFLNEKTGRHYRPVDANFKFIIARLQSGATLRDCFQIIAKKTREWKNDPKMALYLRPATLFNATKFEQYRGELAISTQGENKA